MPQQNYRKNSQYLPDYKDVLEESKKVLRLCFDTYKLEEIFLSFNGGKDCTVLLDIVIKLLNEMCKNIDIASQLKVIYIRTASPFSELEEFIDIVQKHYGVVLKTTEGEIMSTIQDLLDEDSKLKAGLMGTRRTDPYSENLQFMQKTDPSWPQIMRVSPLLNWSYHQIWSYILDNEVPYCSLYDNGYTSIGNTQNTFPNPELAYDDESGLILYHPAWKLTDGSQERAGRTVNQPSIKPINQSIINSLGTVENGIASNDAVKTTFCQNTKCKMI